MIWPPSIVRIHAGKDGERRPAVWLPLVVMWPPALAVGILLAPLVALVALLLWPFGKGKGVLLLGPLAFHAFCRLRGLRVRLRHADRETSIEFM